MQNTNSRAHKYKVVDTLHFVTKSHAFTDGIIRKIYEAGFSTVTACLKKKPEKKI